MWSMCTRTCTLACIGNRLRWSRCTKTSRKPVQSSPASPSRASTGGLCSPFVARTLSASTTGTSARCEGCRWMGAACAVVCCANSSSLSVMLVCMCLVRAAERQHHQTLLLVLEKPSQTLAKTVSNPSRKPSHTLSITVCNRCQHSAFGASTWQRASSGGATVATWWPLSATPASSCCPSTAS